MAQNISASYMVGKEFLLAGREYEIVVTFYASIIVINIVPMAMASVKSFSCAMST